MLDMLKIAEKELLQPSRRLILSREYVGSSRKQALMTFVTCYSDSICYVQDEGRSRRMSLKKCIMPSPMRTGVIFDVHSTYQTDEVFPGYSYYETREDFAMLWDTCVRMKPLTRSSMS